MHARLRPLILTGGPAAGKSTCGRALAVEHDRAAFIDTDDIRQLVIGGGEAPWKGVEGKAQARLAAVNTASLATNFLRAGFEVVIADIVTSATLTAYRANLPDCFVVHLHISLSEARARAATRTSHITDDEFTLLHASLATTHAADVILDVDGLTAEEQVALLRTTWLASPRE